MIHTHALLVHPLKSYYSKWNRNKQKHAQVNQYNPRSLICWDVDWIQFNYIFQFTRIQLEVNAQYNKLPMFPRQTELACNCWTESSTQFEIALPFRFSLNPSKLWSSWSKQLDNSCTYVPRGVPVKWSRDWEQYISRLSFQVSFLKL